MMRSRVALLEEQGAAAAAAAATGPGAVAKVNGGYLAELSTSRTLSQVC